DGHSFTGPVKVLDGGDLGVNVTNLLVLSDGTLFMTYADFPIQPSQRKNRRESNFWHVTSNDGGISFSKSARTGTDRVPPDKDPRVNLSTFPVYAVDTRSKQYLDRLYGVWTDFRSAKARLLFSCSKDRGQTWTEPKPIDASVPASASQFQPVVAVN